jgi:Protein of unknown function (DUF3307)
MMETLAALLLAHVLADFVFQPDWMVARKREPLVLAAHGGVVLLTAVAATGSLDLGLLWLVAVHVAVDALKALGGRGLRPFLLDQAAHLVVLASLAHARPGIWAEGLWAGMDVLPGVMLILAGAIIAARAGGFAVGLLMEPFAAKLPAEISAESLPGAGRVIGQLERGLIFALVLMGQPQGVGLLIAAKSILRFGAVRDDRALSEYVIIGTLASFAWALLVAYATIAGLTALPPLGIPPAMP